MKEQIILKASDDFKEIDDCLLKNEARKVFLVCGYSMLSLKINDYFAKLEICLGIQVVRFSDFAPNPTYDSVEKGVRLFRKENCDFIVAVGGGSAMDVAKCVKLFANMDDKMNYLEQSIVPNSIKLLVVPTTAGTGSEATRFAVIYFKGEKQSVTDLSCIPDVVVMDASSLRSLPKYQRKVTMLDALCHALESFWSVNSTEESKTYSRRAIRKIVENRKAYLRNEEVGNAELLEAAYWAGKAINITQTTAGHAMSYKMTSLYGIAHGHAVALCVSKLWPYMLKHADKFLDVRGKEYLEDVFEEIAEIMGCDSSELAVRKFQEILEELELVSPIAVNKDFEILKKSVNTDRLKNNPIALDESAIDEIYHQILRTE